MMLKTAEKISVKRSVAARKPREKKIRKGSIEALESFRGSWKGGDEELTRLLSEVSELREKGTIRARVKP